LILVVKTKQKWLTINLIYLPAQQFLSIENVDTDQIIAFLKATERVGFDNLFRDWRYNNDDHQSQISF
jgi:3-isopropylmalate dehydratase small subunit